MEIRGAAGHSFDRTLLLVLLIMVIISIPLLKIFFNYTAIRRRATRDYQKARGTGHKSILRNWQCLLNNDTISMRKEHTSLENEIRTAPGTMERMLNDRLYRFLIETKLPDAEGIGEKLTKKILDECYDGTLDSLKRAYIINGVGDSKQQGIDHWIIGIMINIGEHREQGAPGDKEFIREFEAQIREKEMRLKILSEELKKLGTHGSVVRTELDRLEVIDLRAFLKAYLKFERSRTGNEQPFHHYLRGVYPEWEKAPLWFSQLEERYGGYVKEEGSNESTI